VRRVDGVSRIALTHNTQLQRTVIPDCWRGASPSFHYALAPRWTAQREATELRR